MKRLAGSLLLGFLGAAALYAQASPWLPSVKGSAVEGSTQVGYGRDGDPIYLIRSVKDGVAGIGYYEARTKRAYLLSPTGIQNLTSFESWGGGGRWVSADAEGVPVDALSAGKSKEGGQAFLLRVNYAGVVVPALFSLKEGAAVAFIDGKRLLFEVFEVLADDWAASGDADSIPLAFVGGAERSGEELVPIRAPKDKSLTPGKWVPATQRAYLPYGGFEIELGNTGFEYFIGTGIWVTPVDRAKPVGAIPAGWDSDGSTLYMVRAPYNGGDSLGKFAPMRREAYISYGGREIAVSDFQVLCYDFNPADLIESVLQGPRDGDEPVKVSVAEEEAPQTKNRAPAAVALPPPPPKAATASEWGAGTMAWGAGAKAKAPPATKAKALPISSDFGYWTAQGGLLESERLETGLLADSYVYEGKEGNYLGVEVNSQEACPGIFVYAPNGQWLEAYPATQEGGIPGPGGTNVYARMPATGIYTILVANTGRGTGPYSIAGYMTPKANQGALSASSAFSPVELTANMGGPYLIEAVSEAFEPRFTVLDKKTQKVVQAEMFFEDNKKAYAMLSMEKGQTLVIQVRTLDPKSKGSGPFTVTARFQGYGQ